jgi:hypothetical protein
VHQQHGKHHQGARRRYHLPHLNPPLPQPDSNESCCVETFSCDSYWCLTARAGRATSDYSRRRCALYTVSPWTHRCRTLYSFIHTAAEGSGWAPRLNLDGLRSCASVLRNAVRQREIPICIVSLEKPPLDVRHLPACVVYHRSGSWDALEGRCGNMQGLPDLSRNRNPGGATTRPRCWAAPCATCSTTQRRWRCAVRRRVGPFAVGWRGTACTPAYSSTCRC